MERLSKILANAGISSRREAEKLILQGKIKVNGKIIKELGTKVEALDQIEYEGKIIKRQIAPKLWIFYKPKGVVCTRNDEKGRKTIYDVLPKQFKNILYIGRLDINSEGLLLLTNNGDLKRKYELPSSNIERVYVTKLFGEIPENLCGDYLEKGLTIKDFKTLKPMRYFVKIEFMKEANNNKRNFVKFTLKEGKNREIRNICRQYGLNVVKLKRISFGNYLLGELKEGQFKEVDIK
jgi:23S rRNA pseudouridine2605 synthase